MSDSVGPFFRIGPQNLIDRMAAVETGPDAIEIRGEVFDSEGAPVPDAIVEFWGAGSAGAYSGVHPDANELPAGFCRVATGEDGEFSFSISKPGATPMGDGRMQAPHFLVLFFARGLLRHLISRVYFEGDPANEADPVLAGVPAVRRHTLVAQAAEGSRIYNWNILHHPQEMKRVARMIENTPAKGYIGCCEVLRDTDLQALLSKIEARCLVVGGSHDAATPPADGHVLHAGIRGSKYVELDASHLSAWERPAEFAAGVLEFLG